MFRRPLSLLNALAKFSIKIVGFRTLRFPNFVTLRFQRLGLLRPQMIQFLDRFIGLLGAIFFAKVFVVQRFPNFLLRIENAKFQLITCFLLRI